jgi:hypothetical protein
MWEEALSAALKWSIIITVACWNILFLLLFLIRYLYKFFILDDDKSKKTIADRLRGIKWHA